MKRYFSAVLTQLTSPLNVFITLCVAAFLSFAGPFGTFEALPTPLRVTYWSTTVILSVIVVTFLKVAIETRLLHWSAGHRSLLLAVLMAGILGPGLYALAHIMTGAYREITPIWVITLVVFLVTLFIYQLHRFLQSIYGDRRAMPRFVDRIGAEDAADILHVGVDDHYIQVRARTGQHRLLMRFADALHELRELDGLQVHRSHWVARAAVQCMVTEKGKIRLELVDGTHVPVSRAYQQTVLQEFSCQNAMHRASARHR